MVTLKVQEVPYPKTPALAETKDISPWKTIAGVGIIGAMAVGLLLLAPKGAQG